MQAHQFPAVACSQLSNVGLEIKLGTSYSLGCKWPSKNKKEATLPETTLNALLLKQQQLENILILLLVNQQCQESLLPVQASLQMSWESAGPTFPEKT